MSRWNLCYDKKQKKVSAGFFSEKKYDDTLFEDENYIVLIEGVILNLRDLKEEYHCEESGELFVRLYDREGHSFVSSLRGAFTGMVFDKRTEQIYAFGNQTGDTVVFCCDLKDFFMASNYLREGILSCMKEKSVSYSYDEMAAKYLLTYGFMIDDTTFIKEIKRIMPGYEVRYDGVNNLAECIPYHRFTNEKQLDITMEQAVELVDKGFRKAVQRCFNKDNEFLSASGKEWHLADMSGGLDSRMTSWVANKMGYQNIVNICYAQSGSVEEKIAGEVANYLGNDFYFKYLDVAKFIYEIDDLVGMNYGLAYYAGSTGAKDFLTLINQRDRLEHSGQLGDVVIGSFAQTQSDKVSQDSGRYSHYLNYKFESSWYTENIDNNEIFCMYTRGFLGALSSHLIRRNFNCTLSPFLDVDFLELCLSIPTQLRANHKLYFEWIRKCYPDALTIKSTRDRMTVPVRIKNKLCREMRKLLFKVGFVQTSQSKNTMNPFDYWYHTDENIRSFVDRYFADNIERCREDEIYEDLKKLFAKGNVTEKLQVLTVLAVKKNYFD